MTKTKTKRPLKVPKAKKSNFRTLMSKLSGAFMLPISLLAFAGILLGVGNAIQSHTSAVTFGNFVFQIGNGSFGILPLLFCISIAIAYTDDAPVAGFAAVVAWFTFNGLCSSLIFANNPGNLGATTYSIFGWNNVKIYGDISNKLMTNNQGLESFNTSVFGAILVGAVSAYVYNNFSNKELPMVVSFFSGKRLAPIMSAIFMIPVTFIFIFLWPLIGAGLSNFGALLAKSPAHINAFFFGYIERALVPFGLHHVFYAPLWWTSAGGALTQSGVAEALSGGKDHTLQAILGDASMPASVKASAQAFLNAFNNQNLQQPFGDVYIWFFLNHLPSHISFMAAGPNGNLVLSSQATFAFSSSHLGVDVGQYMQGKYPFMIFGLPAAAAAIIVAAPRENRKMAASVAISAVASSFISGITEPIEFTFLFLAPWLFWGVHAVYAGISFWLMAIFGGHIGMVFSGGTIDWLVYGVLPADHGTKFWLVLIIGPIYSVLYYFTFYFAIKRFNIETPGRGSNTKFFTKKDFLNKKAIVNADGTLSIQNQMFVKGFGGWNNIVNYNNCATRLRYDVADMSKIDEATLKEAGAHGVIKMGEKSIQVIVGPRASIVNQQITSKKGTSLKDVETSNDVQSEVIQKSAEHKSLIKPVSVKSAATGNIVALEDLKDEVFSKKMLGDGIAIIPKNGKIYAPISGKLVTVFPTKHAFGIETKEGVQILIHIGIDTVKLDGKGFKSTLKQGQTIKVGDLLAEIDLDLIKKAGYSTEIIVILLNESKGKIKFTKKTGSATKATKLFDIV